MQAGNDVEKVARRRRPAIEGKALCRQLPPGQILPAQRTELPASVSQPARAGCAVAPAGPAPATPPARPPRERCSAAPVPWSGCSAAAPRYSGRELAAEARDASPWPAGECEGPCAIPPGAQRRTAPARQRTACRRQVRNRQKTERGEAVRADPSLILSVVVAPASAPAGRPAVKGRLAADSRLFPFRFRWGVRKGGRHEGLCVDEIIPAFGWKSPRIV